MFSWRAFPRSEACPESQVLATGTLLGFYPERAPMYAMSPRLFPNGLFGGRSAREPGEFRSADLRSFEGNAGGLNAERKE